MKFDFAIKAAILIFSSVALSLMLDLEEPLLDLDDLLLLDLLLLNPTEFLDLTFSLFSSTSFNHLMILCMKLNILSPCSSNTGYLQEVHLLSTNVDIHHVLL